MRHKHKNNKAEKQNIFESTVHFMKKINETSSDLPPCMSSAMLMNYLPNKPSFRISMLMCGTHLSMSRKYIIPAVWASGSSAIC